MTRSHSLATIVGHNIKRLRLNRRESQDALARLLEVTRPVVSNVEAGARCATLRELFILAAHFQVSIDKALLDGLVTAPPFPRTGGHSR
jgi:transcriptional regulator with XRE-family HTH domain